MGEGGVRVGCGKKDVGSTGGRRRRGEGPVVVLPPGGDKDECL